jgi:Flp pilus assembly protein TadG
MRGPSLPARIREAASRFARHHQGNIAVTFAIALVPLISFVGAAIDYSRVSSARSGMQVALDSTALMLSKDLSSGLITTSQIAAKAQAYFEPIPTRRRLRSPRPIPPAAAWARPSRSMDPEPSTPTS